MYPVLFEIGGFELHSFGLTMALAWLAAGVYLDRGFRRGGLPREMVSDLLIWALGGALIGARLLFLFVEYPSWTEDVFGAIFSRSGFVFYGGLAGGLIAGIWLVRRSGFSIPAVGDLVAPALAIGLAVGRLGCFLVGDDYGRPTHLPWAVTFTNPKSLAPLGIPLHPVQIYLSLNALVLFMILHARLVCRRFEGEVFALFFILYSITRFFWEFFRGDPRGEFGGLSTSQWISVVALPAGIWLYFHWKMKSRAKI